MAGEWMDKSTLDYSNFERLPIPQPVDRLSYIAEACRGKIVLDIGCLDETALVKQDSPYWLHQRISRTAKRVIGVDNSRLVPEEGISTGPNSRIMRGDATNRDVLGDDAEQIDVIVAGEFIEHIEDPSAFLRMMKKSFDGKTLILSTPNGMSLSNSLMGLFRREVQHPDHLHNFTFKTLNTLCMRAEFRHWKIIPYRFFATEMILRTTGLVRVAARCAEFTFRLGERLFPNLSFGYIVHVEI